jgi:hypothetical protein
MNISNFISHINQYTGPALANRFRVDIVPPNAVFKNRASLTRSLSFQCEAAELPGRTINTLDARTYGPTIKYPYQTSYNDLNLTFICMGNKIMESFPGESESVPNTGLWEKTFFDDWLNFINPTDLYNFNYKSDYQTAITIHHYDVHSSTEVENNFVNQFLDPTYSVDFFDVFPTSVNQLQLGWADDSILKLTVTFAYRKWENRKTAETRANNDVENRKAIELQRQQREAALAARREEIERNITADAEQRRRAEDAGSFTGFP